MPAVIQIEKLSKQYYIQSQKREPYQSLREVVTSKVKESFTGFLNSSERISHSGKEEFWALKDINLEIHQGEKVGIIGRNGAGKSTLLKILSRITEPTSGKIKIKGRVASLLEVGTGFHPELTGRENIYLNGAILGMTRRDIKAKFDQIVSFAEVEKFLDTPVKHYSSGMYVRLAFAVAAHLEPEILIVDEVLAVGDVQFQKKCLGKMEEAGKEGRTILFVSHNMGMISSLCEKAVLLESGRNRKIGIPSDVILEYYTGGHASPSSVDFTKLEKKVGDEYVALLEAYVMNEKGEKVSEIDLRERFFVAMRFKILQTKVFSALFPYPSYHFFASDGTCAFYSSPSNPQLENLVPGEYVARCYIPGNLLNSGTYFVGFGFSDCEKGVNTHFYEPNALCFHVTEPIEKTLYENRNGFSGVIPGIVRPKLEWHLKKE